jgi:uracil-DNA glycosylase family 4
VEARAEIKEIIGHLKDLITANREMGMEPPPISKEVLKNGETEIQEHPLSHNEMGHFTSLEELRAFIGECQGCKLSAGRNHLVFGEGAPDARLVFVGEGPGKDEDLAGRPFVGEAGALLTRIVQAMGLQRDQVYICNVVKCRPPNNRDPERDEIEACKPFLKQQLHIIRPEVICTLGRIAAQELLGYEFRITRERGQWHTYEDIPLMPTYHPAYILRNPSRERELKGQVWKDIQEIMKHLGLEVKQND